MALFTAFLTLACLGLSHGCSFGKLPAREAVCGMNRGDKPRYPFIFLGKVTYAHLRQQDERDISVHDYKIEVQAVYKEALGSLPYIGKPGSCSRTVAVRQHGSVTGLHPVCLTYYEEGKTYVFFAGLADEFNESSQDTTYLNVGGYTSPTTLASRFFKSAESNYVYDDLVWGRGWPKVCSDGPLPIELN